MEDEEEAEMERADVAKDMPPLKLFRSCSTTSQGTGRTKGIV